jgi:hypothetical protein
LAVSAIKTYLPVSASEATVNAEVQLESQSSSNYGEDNDEVEATQCSVASDSLLAAILLFFGACDSGGDAEL